MHTESASQTHPGLYREGWLLCNISKSSCFTSPSRPVGHHSFCSRGPRCCPPSSIAAPLRRGSVGTVLLTPPRWGQGFCPPGVFSSASATSSSRARSAELTPPVPCCAELFWPLKSGQGRLCGFPWKMIWTSWLKRAMSLQFQKHGLCLLPVSCKRNLQSWQCCRSIHSALSHAACWETWRLFTSKFSGPQTGGRVEIQTVMAEALPWGSLIL